MKHIDRLCDISHGGHRNHVKEDTAVIVLVRFSSAMSILVLDHEHRSRRSVVATEKMFHASRNAAPSAAFQDFEKRNPGFLLATTRPQMVSYNEQQMPLKTSESNP